MINHKPQPISKAISYAPTFQVIVVMVPTAASDVSDEDIPYLPEDREKAVETDWDIL